MSRKFFITFVLLFLYFFFAPRALNIVNAATCKDKSPASAPILTSAVAGKDSVTLTWTEAQDPLTYYLVAYGRSETEIEYGNPNVGGKGTTTYTVGGLVRGVKYYFKVRPVNGCKPGKFSNKLSATPGFIKKSIVNTPNLSIYKSVQGASISATSPTEAKVKMPVPPVMASEEPFKCLTCVSWQLLIVEAILLILYLYLAGKNNFLKQIFSIANGIRYISLLTAIAIPIVMYILFRKINQECSLREFACKYFLPLEIIILMVIVIAYKKINFKTNLFNKTKKRKKK